MSNSTRSVSSVSSGDGDQNSRAIATQPLDSDDLPVHSLSDSDSSTDYGEVRKTAISTATAYAGFVDNLNDKFASAYTKSRQRQSEMLQMLDSCDHEMGLLSEQIAQHEEQISELRRQLDHETHLRNCALAEMEDIRVKRPELAQKLDSLSRDERRIKKKVHDLKLKIRANEDEHQLHLAIMSHATRSLSQVVAQNDEQEASLYGQSSMRRSQLVEGDERGIAEQLELCHTRIRRLEEELADELSRTRIARDHFEQTKVPLRAAAPAMPRAPELHALTSEVRALRSALAEATGVHKALAEQALAHDSHASESASLSRVSQLKAQLSTLTDDIDSAKARNEQKTKQIAQSKATLSTLTGSRVDRQETNAQAEAMIAKLKVLLARVITDPPTQSSPSRLTSESQTARLGDTSVPINRVSSSDASSDGSAKATRDRDRAAPTAAPRPQSDRRDRLAKENKEKASAQPDRDDVSLSSHSSKSSRGSRGYAEILFDVFGTSPVQVSAVPGLVKSSFSRFGGVLGAVQGGTTPTTLHPRDATTPATRLSPLPSRTSPYSPLDFSSSSSSSSVLRGAESVPRDSVYPLARLIHANANAQQSAHDRDRRGNTTTLDAPHSRRSAGRRSPMAAEALRSSPLRVEATSEKSPSPNTKPHRHHHHHHHHNKHSPSSAQTAKASGGFPDLRSLLKPLE
eukprot:gnl/Spiro4/5685_TR2907_c1_g1_i1.p1 gnl/Spiro4/5685_TR2907_c1_g1~~gnl/Spiro4/5685_TR2907_c1_g1_i1.p1  ORF type:complete len:713 (-),score=182.83 gnl/Spiro4/5685_TR2907_c1_g1_i1:80-2137(-)